MFFQFVKMFIKTILQNFLVRLKRIFNILDMLLIRVFCALLLIQLQIIFILIRNTVNKLFFLYTGCTYRCSPGWHGMTAL